MPLEEDLSLAYKTYYTHQSGPEGRDPWLRRLYRKAQDGYIASRYGYEMTEAGFLGRILGILVYLDPYRRADADSSVFYLHAKKDGRLLEVGCGDGAALVRLQGLAWGVEGVDFDPVAVKNAQAKGIKVRQGSVVQQGFASDIFDVVVTSHVIEHIHDPLAFLQECHRILKPQGVMVVITPNAAGWGHRNFRSNWRGLEPPRHLHLFSSSSLCTLVSRTGFSRVSCTSTPRGVSAHLASRSLERSCKVVPSTLPVAYQRIRAEAMGLAAWGRLKLDRESGEELLLFAVKSPTQM